MTKDTVLLCIPRDGNIELRVSHHADGVHIVEWWLPEGRKEHVRLGWATRLTRPAAVDAALAALAHAKEQATSGEASTEPLRAAISDSAELRVTCRADGVYLQRWRHREGRAPVRAERPVRVANDSELDEMIKALQEAKQMMEPRNKPVIDLTDDENHFWLHHHRPHNIAAGLMTGIAVGNLLGLRYEFSSQSEIARSCPDGVWDIDVPHGMPDDDDLAQSIIIAEAAAAGPLDVDDLGRRLLEWEETNGMGIGILTADVLHLQRSGMPIAEASREAWGGNRAGNGAIMRCAPLAIRWRDDPNALVRNSIVSAVPTHWDPRCGWSCAILNLAIAAVMQQDDIRRPPSPPTASGLLDAAQRGMRASLPELAQYGYDDHAPDVVREAVHDAFRMELRDLTLDGGNQGYTLLALQAGLISLLRAPTFESGLRAIVEAGGDTDTNGAVAGAALGARFSYFRIPEHWREKAEEVRRGRIPLTSYAHRLVEIRVGQRHSQRDTDTE